jgi:hypothetical protein
MASMASRTKWLAAIARLVVPAGVPASPPRALGPPATAPAWPGTGLPRPGAALARTADASGDSVTSYLADLLASTRDELARADSKAALLLASVGVIIGALTGGLSSRSWTPMSLGVGQQALWWSGVAVAAFGSFLISASVYPRTKRAMIPGGLPAYFRDIAAYPDVNAFRQAIGTAPDAAERLINQTYAVARIVRAKYVQLQVGLLCLFAAVVACMLSVILNVLLA